TKDMQRRTAIKVARCAEIAADLAEVLHCNGADKFGFVDADFECKKLELDFGKLEHELGLEKGEIMGMLVAGDLRVAGNIVNLDIDEGPSRFVGKSLSAENMILGGSTVIVQERLDIKTTLVCRYNHGQLIVVGPASAELMCTGECSVRFHDTVQARLVE